MSGEAPKYLIVQSFQCSRPFWIVKHLDALQFLVQLEWETKSLHPVEAPKELHAAEGKRVRLLRDRNLTTDMEEPVVMASEVGWSLSGHSGPFKRP
jgi:hypothetical protein